MHQHARVTIGKRLSSARLLLLQVGGAGYRRWHSSSCSRSSGNSLARLLGLLLGIR